MLSGPFFMTHGMPVQFFTHGNLETWANLCRLPAEPVFAALDGQIGHFGMQN